MIHYIVAVGGPSVVDGKAEQLRAALDASCTPPEAPHLVVARNRGWAAAYIEDSDVVSHQRAVATGDSLAIVNGPAVPREGSSTELAQRVLSWMLAGGPERVTRELVDSFAAVCIDPAIGTISVGDFSGITPLYWAEIDGLVVLTNRSTAAGHVVGGGTLSLREAAWTLGFNGAVVGEALPTRSVRSVVPGQVGRVPWGGSTISFGPSDSWVWPGPDEPSRETLEPDEWDAVVEDLTTAMTTIACVDDEPKLHLSGGKDSRACLALLAGAGFASKVKASSIGPPEDPDVVLAAEVARRAGVSSFTNVGGAADRERWEAAVVARIESGRQASQGDDAVAQALARRDASSVPRNMARGHGAWSDLRQMMHTYEAIVNPWWGGGVARVGITGQGGELYRRGVVNTFRRQSISTVADAVDALHAIVDRSDPLGVLQPGIVQYQKTWLTNWAQRTAGEIRLDLLPEKFYTDFRMGHWNGALMQARISNCVFSPLLSQQVAARYFQLRSSPAQIDRLHYEVIRRTCPALLEVPFASDEWPVMIREGAPEPLPRPTMKRRASESRLGAAVRSSQVARRAIRSSHATTWLSRRRRRRSDRSRLAGGNPLALGWQWRLLNEQSAEARVLFGDASGVEEFSDTFDDDRLSAAVTAGPATTGEAIQLVGAIGLALAALDERAEVG